MSKLLLQCKNLCKSYQKRNTHVDILRDINFSMFTGEIISVVGSSGSGKSTLLHLLGSLDTPSSGDIIFLGQMINKMSSFDKAKMRNREIGFVYQFHHLLLDFTVLENVAMPLLISKKHPTEIQERTSEMLKAVNLWYHRKCYPSSLSGGERQRVAIARALVNNPRLVLADEPTGNLDSYTANSIFYLLKNLNKLQGTAFLIVTHDYNLAKKTDRQIEICNGQICHTLSSIKK